MQVKRQIRAGGTRGTVFREAARLRLDDGRVLLNARRLEGAVYLAGYAVECILKWASTARNEWVYLPERLETHSWDVLLAASGLGPLLKKQKHIHSLFSVLSERWGPELRYRGAPRERIESEKLYEDMKTIYSWIAENTI